MASLASRSTRLALFAAVLLAACEPLTLRVLPGGGIVIEDPDAPEAGEEPGLVLDGEPGDAGPDAQPDSGTDAGPEVQPDAGLDELADAGPDAGPGELPDAGPAWDGGISGWSACADGWQRRVVLPLGGKGFTRFGLDGNREAYFTEYTDGHFKVVSTAPDVARSDTGWDGGPWLGGVAVDGQGTVHLGISALESESSLSPPVYHLSNAGGAWSRKEVSRGQVLDFSLDAEGFAHMLTVRSDASYRLLHVHNKLGLWVAESIGVEIGSSRVYAAMRLDAQGHVHIVYRGILLGSQGTFYVTNASGKWVRELVSEQVGLPTIAVGPTGVPHVLWTGVAGGVQLGVRRQEGGWDVSVVEASAGGTPSAAVDAQGVLHVVTANASSNKVVYVTGTPGNWSQTTLASLEDPATSTTSSLWLVLDGEGRVHTLYSLLFDAGIPGTRLRLIEYARQCP